MLQRPSWSLPFRPTEGSQFRISIVITCLALNRHQLPTPANICQPSSTSSADKRPTVPTCRCHPVTVQTYAIRMSCWQGACRNCEEMKTLMKLYYIMPKIYHITNRIKQTMVVYTVYLQRLKLYPDILVTYQQFDTWSSWHFLEQANAQSSLEKVCRSVQWALFH